MYIYYIIYCILALINCNEQDTPLLIYNLLYISILYNLLYIGTGQLQ